MIRDAEMPQSRTPHPTTFLPLAAGYAPLMGHHRHLLDDRVRTQAFRRAIARAVTPGDVVADLGTGTGVLAIAARQAGARAVYAIERDPIIHVAAAIAAHNGIAGITWLAQHSRDVTLPEPIDVLVSECFGVLAIGGTMLEAVCELRARHLRAGGRVVPRSVTIHVAPVDTPRDFAHVDVWSRRRYGLDFAPAAQLARNQPYIYILDARGVV
jgi:predicted RNA methylase